MPCFGTTHADHFCGPVPVTRRLRDDEIREEYEQNTGVVIVECFRERGIDPAGVPAALVAGHGPFVWGESPRKAVENAIALEATAQIALNTLRINAEATEIERILLEKHYRRKHGTDAYYGQQQ